MLTGQIAAIRKHPLNEGRGWLPVASWLSWQASGRLLGRRIYRWVDDIRFEAKPGMHGITPSIPTGLAEYHHMAFTLHYLRPCDLLIDVGANVGGYSLLAAAAGAEAILIEPSSEALPGLQRNLDLNRLEFEVYTCALAEQPGTGRISQGKGAQNHLSDFGEQVEIFTLDQVAAGRVPALVKIDVEGAEHRVIAGGAETLRRCPAVIAEVWGEAEGEAHRKLREMGFRPMRYHPRKRVLEALAGPDTLTQNTLYLRDPGAAVARLRRAPQFNVMGRQI